MTVTIALFLLFAVVLFFPTTSVQDYLTNSGWLCLSVLLLGLSLFGLWSKKPISLPSKKILILFGIYSFLLILFSIINKATFFEERWSQRYVLGLAAFICFQYFSSEQKINSYLKFPLFSFLAFLTIESLYQYLTKCQYDDPLARSCYASRLWNINMLAQALALSLPFLILFLKYSKNKLDSFFNYSIIILCTLVTLLTACRSAIISVLIFYVIEFIFPHSASRKKIFFAGVSSLILFFSLNSFKNNLSNSIGDDKKGSANYRLEVWRKSVAMGTENPFGIGVNNFEFGFLPYKRDSNFDNMKTEVDKSPHNEFVRILAEEGWILLIAFSCAIFSAIFLGFHSIQKKGNDFFLRFILVLLPELFFQFPTEMFFPVFLFSVALATRPMKGRQIPFSYIKYLAVILIAVVCTSLLYIRNVKIIPKEYSTFYCKIFPDNWKMCGEYFKEHYEDGNFDLASQTMEPVIKRQPFNYIALHFDYMLGNPINNSEIVCNYWNLFAGKDFIPESDISSCEKIKTRADLIQKFKTYAERR
ncbi:MAG: O-antigen ligase family protein [Bdellovibrionota bacterium]